MTVNQASKLDRYPIPQVEDLLGTLAGGKSFTKLDVSQAYQQLVFGIPSTLGVFQRIMESLLRHIPGVII